jgi:DNA mismatch repair protein MutL
VALFGKSYQEQLMPCKEDTELLKINGYIGKPDASKKSRGEQYFFVNNRFIKSNYLNHAVMTAYKNLVGVDVFPLYVLFLEIDPKHIDINVHPTKTEIKFDDERTIYHLIMASVRKSLGIFNVVPSIDFGLNVNFDPFTTAHSQGNTIPKHNDSKAFSFIDKYPSQQERNNQAHWQSLYQGFDNESTSHQPTERIASRVNVLSLPISDDLVTAKPEPKNCIQVQQKYIIAKLKSGLLIVNQQAASERILFERFQQSLLQKSGTSQQNLFPFTIELNPSDYQLVMEIDAQIRNLGFDFSAFSSNTIVVNGIPADVKNTNEKELFIGLIEQYKMYGSDIKLDINEKLARSMAKRSAIKTGQLLSNEEMDILIDQLFGCAMPHTDPAGKPAYTILDLGKIESLF